MEEMHPPFSHSQHLPKLSLHTPFAIVISVFNSPTPAWTYNYFGPASAVLRGATGPSSAGPDVAPFSLPVVC